MRILLTGVTGTAGSAVLREALVDSRIQDVICVSRRSPAETSSKVRSLALHDFANWKPVQGRLAGIDAAIWSLGISQTQVTRDELRRVTHDFTIAGAKAIKDESPDVAFVFLSGGGADPTLKSRMPFAVEKGRTENALDAMGFRRNHHIRPAYIHPEKPGGTKPFAERLLSGLEPVVRAVWPSAVIHARDLARAMIAVALNGDEKHVLENRDLRRLAGLTRGI